MEEKGYELSAISHQPIHIGLNAHLLSLTENYRGAGINRYIYSLLLSLPLVDGNNRYTAFLSERGMRTQSPPSLTLRLSSLPTAKPPVRILWEQLIQPLELVREGINVLHSLAYALPLICPSRSVVTIHDLSFLLFPQVFNRFNRLYLSACTSLAARKANAIIAVSENTKRDVVRLLAVPPDRVTVVPNGIDESFHPIADQRRVEEFRCRRGLPKRMILFVGTLEPRKNVGRLIRAYAQLKRGAVIPHKLILVGGRGWLYESIFALAEQLELQREVLFPGFIPYEELPWWYNAADLFVYPSLYEGFGLPPLEAMACGTPVIVSHASSLPELVGEAGLTVDPLSVEELAEAMGRVINDEALSQAMRKRGLERAKDFSWLETARKTRRVYSHLVGNGGN